MKTTLTLEPRERPIWAAFYAEAIGEGLDDTNATAAANAIIVECRRIAAEKWPEQTMN